MRATVSRDHMIGGLIGNRIRHLVEGINENLSEDLTKALCVLMRLHGDSEPPPR